MLRNYFKIFIKKKKNHIVKTLYKTNQSSRVYILKFLLRVVEKQKTKLIRLALSLTTTSLDGKYGIN